MRLRNLVSWLKGLTGGSGYASTDPKKAELKEGWAPAPTPGDAALAEVLPDLTAQGRDLDRQAAKARAIVHGFRADVVGLGIGIEPQPGTPELAKILRDGFNAWAEQAHVDETTDLWTMQWTAGGDVVTSGAFLWRWVTVDAAGIPLRLLPLELEWLSPEPHPSRSVPTDRFCQGAEFDDLGRLVAWHLRRPGTEEIEVVPAADIIHGAIPHRARQHHGEPVLAPLILRLLQDDKLVSTELAASINTSNVSGVIKTHDADLALGGPAGSTDTRNPGAPPTTKATANRRLRPGGTLVLQDGEDWETVENKRPAQGIGAFRAALDGDIAGGANLSRQWLDRDSARADYSSMREDNLRTRRSLGPVQRALGRAMAGKVYRRLVPYILLQAGQAWPASPIARARLLRYDLRPDRIAYVDPQKDAEAEVYQIEHNLKTLEESLAEQGRDLDTVLAQRAVEQRKIDAAAVERVKRLDEMARASGIDGLTWAHLVTLAGANIAPGAYLGAAVKDPPAEPRSQRTVYQRNEAGDIVAEILER